MQNFLRLWLNAGAQITHGGQVQRPRQRYSCTIKTITQKYSTADEVVTQADLWKRHLIIWMSWWLLQSITNDRFYVIFINCHQSSLDCQFKKGKRHIPRKRLVTAIATQLPPLPQIYKLSTSSLIRWRITHCRVLCCVYGGPTNPELVLNLASHCFGICYNFKAV